MKMTMKVNQEFDVKFLKVNAGIRYPEDGHLNGEPDEYLKMPCLSEDGDRWCPVIEIETGKIVNWHGDKPASLHYKVCDDGRYELHETDSEDSEPIWMHEGYVLSCMCPEKNGYGDYFIMEIDASGQIVGWKKSKLIADVKEYSPED